MKLLGKRICVLVLVFYFLLQPIFMIVMNVGKVEAGLGAVYQKIVYTSTLNGYELDGQIDSKKETARLIGTEYRYIVHYERTMGVKKVHKKYADFFKVGKAIGSAGSSSDQDLTLNSRILIKDSIVIQELDKGYLNYSITVEADFATPWDTTKRTLSDFKRISFAASPGTSGLYITSELIPKNFSYVQTRYVWEVVQKVNNSYLDKFPNLDKNSSNSTTNNSTTNNSTTNNSTTNNSTTNNSTTNNSTTNKPSNSTNTTKPSNPTNSKPSTAPKIYDEKTIKISDYTKKQYIKSLYKVVLGRDISENEYSFHINGSVYSMAIGIIFSEESKNRNNLNNISNEEFVKKCYQYILGRDGETEGVQVHTNWLNSGNTRENLVRVFINSDEFTNRLDYFSKIEENKLQNVINKVEEKNISIEENTKKIFVRNLYVRVLGREPSIDEINSHAKGTVHQFVNSIIFSQESENRNKISKMTNKQFIKSLNYYLFGTEASEEKINHHAACLNGGDIRKNRVTVFLNSDEFELRVNKKTQTLTFDKNTNNAIYSYLKNANYSVIKPEDTTLIMNKEDVKKIQQLDLSGKNVTDISKLSIFSNLAILNLNDNKITNLSEVSKLLNLEHLSIKNNNVTDITPVFNLVNLTYLNASGNNISSLEGINKLSKLTYLYLNDCNLLNKILPIFDLTNLIKLELDNNNISSGNISTISKLNKLEKISLNNNAIISLESIANMATLKEVLLNNNNVSTIANSNSNISLKNNLININTTSKENNLPDILVKVKDSNNKLYTQENLQCTNCKIENNKIIIELDKPTATIKVVGGKADGTIVTIVNQLTSISFTDKVLVNRLQKVLGDKVLYREDESNVYKLYFNKTTLNSINNMDLSATVQDTGKITNISGLEKFSNLKVLSLNNNNVTNLDKLSNLTKLETLNIRNNNLTNLAVIYKLTNLKQLDASDNYITNIDAVSSLTNLNDLILSNNNIENNLAPISKLTNLTSLSLSNNNITDVSSLANLKLEKLYLSYNKILDISNIHMNTLEVLNVNNNTIQLNIEGRQLDIPLIVAKATDAQGGIKNIETINCAIENNSIVIFEGEKYASIKILNGIYKDSIININTIGDNTPPKLTVEYNKIESNGNVRVVVTANENIKNVFGWDRGSDRNEIYKEFKYNVKNQYIYVKDLYGNETKQLIEFSSINNSKIPGLTVSYSNSAVTNEDVVVTICSTEELHKIPDWTLSADKKSMTRKYSENTNRDIANVLTEQMYNVQMQPENVEIQINNIDKKSPECEVSYSTSNATKSSVVVSINSDEEIELKNANGKVYRKTQVQDANGNVKYRININYTYNTTEDIVVKDLAGNETTVKVSIINIDDIVDGLYVKSSSITATNGNVKLIVGANEQIKVNSNIAKIANSKLAVANVLFRIAGNTTVMPIMQGRITSNSIGDIAYINNTPIFIAENEQNNTLYGENSYEVDVPELEIGTIQVEDKVGNTEVVLYNGNVIDTSKPNLYREEDVVNEDGSITATIAADEEIVIPDELNGWILSEDKMKVSKIFNSNVSETIKVADIAGNEQTFDVVVDVNGFKYTLIYEPLEKENKILVVISAENELQPLEGWELSEDKKMLGKLVAPDYKQDVIIKDINGKVELVNIDTTDKIEFDNNELNEDKEFIDDTKTLDDIPQTGKYMVFAGISIMILIVYSTIVLVIEHKKNCHGDGAKWQ